MEMIDGEDAGGAHGSIGAGAAGRRMVTLALMLAMAVAALEQTVVSTAMPTIIARLKGLDIYPWVFSAYLLASTVSTPLYGKLGMDPATLQATAAAIQGQIPLGRFGTPEELASTVLHLSAKESAFIVGSELIVDGGMSNL